VGVWNDGREPIRRSDLIDRDPLRIEIPKDIRILDTSIIEQTSKGIDASFSYQRMEENQALLLAFEYLDYRDGFLLQIVHDGSAGVLCRITGKIVGSAPIQRYHEIAGSGSIQRSSEIMSRVFGKRPRLFASLAIALYGGAGILGVSLWFFGLELTLSTALMLMGLPALLLLPAVFRRNPPIDVNKEKKA
jgi:hypothetical protein